MKLQAGQPQGLGQATPEGPEGNCSLRLYRLSGPEVPGWAQHHVCRVVTTAIAAIVQGYQ